MRPTHECVIDLRGRRVEYRVIASRAARKLRVRVGPTGVEVTRPEDRTGVEVATFLVERASWVLDQIRRVERLRAVRRSGRGVAGQLLFRGVPTPLRLYAERNRERRNRVKLVNGEILVRLGERSSTPPARSLETWLRKQAREAIETQLTAVTARIRQQPGRVYVMSQRTKWGNCSARRNLSFNWRLILAPDFVLRYLVTHEAVHLVVPDHSAKFWLTVQSLCSKTERAKQWLCANHARLTVDLNRLLSEQAAGTIGLAAENHRAGGGGGGQLRASLDSI